MRRSLGMDVLKSNGQLILVNGLVPAMMSQKRPPKISL